MHGCIARYLVIENNKASSVLAANGCVPRKSNGRKIHDIDYEPIIEDGGGYPSYEVRRLRVKQGRKFLLMAHPVKSAK